MPTKPCAGNVLANARNAAGLKQYQVGQMMSTAADTISADTVSNWECNRAMPDPEQVAEMELLYESPGLWDAFMRQQWPSFRERIPESPQIINGILASVVNARHQITNILPMLEGAEVDSVDGVLDNKAHAAKTADEARQVAAALLTMADRIEGKGG